MLGHELIEQPSYHLNKHASQPYSRARTLWVDGQDVRRYFALEYGE